MRDKSNIKKILEIKSEMQLLSDTYDSLEIKLVELQEEEQKLWVKKGACTICGCTPKDGYTEWHHIISQHKCKKEGLDHLISARSNVVELCKRCHDLTTASMLRSNLEGATKKVSKENQDKEPTENQIKFIKKLGGDMEGINTRQEASYYIDELKKEKGRQ